MLDLISKFPQLERPKNVLNDLKRNKEEVEIENAIVKSMTRRANKITKIKNASKQARLLRRRPGMSLIEEDTANPDNWDEDGVESGKNLSLHSISESCSLSEDGSTQEATFPLFSPIALKRAPKKGAFSRKDVVINQPLFQTSDCRKSTNEAEKSRVHKRKLSIPKNQIISKYVNFKKSKKSNISSIKTALDYINTLVDKTGFRQQYSFSVNRPENRKSSHCHNPPKPHIPPKPQHSMDDGEKSKRRNSCFPVSSNPINDPNTKKEVLKAIEQILTKIDKKEYDIEMIETL